MPVTQSARAAAAIDIGSNSVHVLAARSLQPVRARARTELAGLVDASDLIGLGDQVDAGGTISPEGLQAVVESIERQIALATEAGAARVVLMGTEPLRRAKNADELNAAVERATGHTIAVLTERQEAKLTFLGVTGGQSPEEALAVIDIGGGSTEAAIHIPGSELDVVPLPFGSGRLTNAIVHHDPPTIDELTELLATAHELVGAAIWPEHAGVAIRRAIFVGGTATNVARLGLLDRAHLNEDMSTLAQMTAEEVMAKFEVRPRRARQLAAGVAIISALLDRFLLGQAEVSQASLRDGAIIAVLARGDAWLDSLDELIG